MKKKLMGLGVLALIILVGQCWAEAVPSPVGFKGLNLDMTLDDFKTFVSAHKFLTADYSDMEGGRTSVTLGMGSDDSSQEAMKKCIEDELDFFNIGCIGTGGDAHCHSIDSTVVVFHDGKAISVSIGREWTPEQVEGFMGLKEWLQFAKKGITKKYGEPSKVSLSPDNVTILSVGDPGYLYTIVEWKKHNDRIRLDISKTSTHYAATVEFENVAEQKKMQKVDEATHSGF
jgi:hypothetical protein